MNIACPKCGRWLAEVIAGGRAICRDCKLEVAVRSTKVPA